jgi:hypothetical protein
VDVARVLSRKIHKETSHGKNPVTNIIIFAGFLL